MADIDEESEASITEVCIHFHEKTRQIDQGGRQGVAGVAAATPFFEPGKIRNFVISFL